MKKRDATSMSLRFSQEAKRLLREISKRQGVSMTAILALAIRKEAKELDIQPEARCG